MASTKQHWPLTGSIIDWRLTGDRIQTISPNGSQSENESIQREWFGTLTRCSPLVGCDLLGNQRLRSRKKGRVRERERAILLEQAQWRIPITVLIQLLPPPLLAVVPKPTTVQLCVWTLIQLSFDDSGQPESTGVPIGTISKPIGQSLICDEAMTSKGI